MKPVPMLVTIVLSLIALGHLLRLVFHTPVIVGGFTVPMWMSVVGCLFMGGLAFMLWQEARRK